MGVGRLVFRMFMGVTAPVPWVPACRQPSSIGRGVAVSPRSRSGMTNAALLLRTEDFVHAFLPIAGRIA